MLWKERKKIKTASLVPKPEIEIGSILTRTMIDPIEIKNQKERLIINDFASKNKVKNLRNQIIDESVTHAACVFAFSDFMPL
jgi:hypothetical protein